MQFLDMTVIVVLKVAGKPSCVQIVLKASPAGSYTWTGLEHVGMYPWVLRWFSTSYQIDGSYRGLTVDPTDAGYDSFINGTSLEDMTRK